MAGELWGLVRMDQHLSVSFLRQAAISKELKNEIGVLTAVPRPTDHTAGIFLDHNHQIEEALIGFNIGNVGEARTRQERQR